MVNSYFQRLAAQTWGLAPAHSPAPKRPSPPAHSGLHEENEQVTAPQPSAEIPSLLPEPKPVFEGPNGDAMPSLRLVKQASERLDAPSQIIPRNYPVNESAPQHYPASPTPVPNAASLPNQGFELNIEAPEPFNGPSIAAQNPLKGLLPESPVMEEIIRWLSAPPVLIAGDSSRQHSMEPSGEEIIEFPPQKKPPLIPARSLQSTVREDSEPAYSVSARRIEPDVIVSIGSVHVTIEAPPPAPIRNIERPAPPLVTTRPPERRSTLARHYL